MKQLVAIPIGLFIFMATTSASVMTEANNAGAVTLAIVHAEKCSADQPSMKAEIDSAFSLWKQRNQKYIIETESREDFNKNQAVIREIFKSRGALPVSDCQLLIQRARSPESDLHE